MLAFAAALPQINPPGGGGPPGLPSLQHVGIDQKDYQGNVQTTERSIFPTPHPAIEYNQAPGFNVQVSHIAYVKGGSASVKLRVFNRRVNPVSGSLAFTQARLMVPGPNYTDPGPHYLPVSLSVSGGSFSLQPNGTAELTATISGLPSHVAVGALQVQYNMPLTENPGTPQALQADNGTQGNWQTWERICVLDAAPIGLQAVPWTDFLEYTCRWAFGASGTTEVLREMTRGIHYSNRSPWNRHFYNPALPKYWTWVRTYYDLSKYLFDIGDPTQSSWPSHWVELDCQDFAGLLFLAFQSHGKESFCREVESAQTAKFTTWPMCRAGMDSTIVGPVDSADSSKSGSYGSFTFNMHLITVASSGVYDSSSSYLWSNDGWTWVNPAWAWGASSHWQRSNWPHYGLVYRGTNSGTADKFDFNTLPLGIDSQSVVPTINDNVSPTVVI
jgi:hypothetical protein